jgi:hypothetical protein
MPTRRRVPQADTTGLVSDGSVTSGVIGAAENGTEAASSPHPNALMSPIAHVPFVEDLPTWVGRCPRDVHRYARPDYYRSVCSLVCRDTRVLIRSATDR